jgi:hypothetical protein
VRTERPTNLPRTGGPLPSPGAMITLRSQFANLAANLAQEVIAVLQSASLNDLASSGGGAATANPRRPRAVAAGDGMPGPLSVPTAPKTRKYGRLPRRSDEEIQATLNKIVLLVKTHREGMRAEEIRAKLGLLSKEMPRILKEGIATKKLTSEGQKRATRYSAK